MNRRVALAELAIVWLALVVKAMLMRWLVLHDATVFGAVLYEGAMILAVLVVIDLLFPDHRFWALWTTDALLSAAMLATVLYAGYYGQIATVDLLRLAGQVPAIKDSVRGLVSPVQLLFAFDLIALLAARWLLTRRSQTSAALETAIAEPTEAIAAQGSSSDVPRRPATDHPTLVRQHLAVYVLTAPIVVYAVVLALGVSHLPQPVDGMVASRKGILAYQIGSLVPRASGAPDNVDIHDPRAVQAEIERLRGGTTGKRFADFAPGAFKGKNVIVVQCESLQTAAIGLKVQGKEVTPNLNRLATESWYFPNTFTQVGGGNTADAEFVVNTSLYPPMNTAASERWGDREVPSLPRILRDAGYKTATFHTNTAHFWNRVELYGALGFDRFYDNAFYGNEDVMGMGPSDEVLFSKTVPKLVEMDKSGSPFYAQIITLSAHLPFDGVPEARRPLQLTGPYAKTFTGDYLTAQAYADKALGEFFDELDRTGLSKDSIVVVYGDHFGLVEDKPSANKVEAQRALLGREMTEADLLTIPLFVRMPGQKTGTEIRDTVGQADIMPTVADALGLDLSGTAHFGHSAFVRSPVLMPTARIVALGSFVDGRVLFVPGMGFDDGHVYSAETKLQVESDPSQRSELDRARAIITLSQQYADGLRQRSDYVRDDKALQPAQ